MLELSEKAWDFINDYLAVEVTDEEKIMIYNEICERNGEEFDKVYPMSSFDELFTERSPLEIATMVCDYAREIWNPSEFTIRYFRIDSVGDAEFGERVEDLIDDDDLAREVARFIEEEEETFGIPEFEKILTEARANVQEEERD